MPETVRAKLKSLFPYFLLAVAVIAAHRILSELSFFAGIAASAWRIITPFFYGFLLAYVVNIPYGGIRRLLQKSRPAFLRRAGRPLAAILTVLFFSGLLFLVVYMLIPHVYRIAAFFIVNLPAYFERLLQYVDYFNSLELFGLYISAENLLAVIQNMVAGINLENLAAPLNALFGVPMAIFTAVIAFISSVYILVEKRKFKKSRNTGLFE